MSPLLIRVYCALVVFFSLQKLVFHVTGTAYGLDIARVITHILVFHVTGAAYGLDIAWVITHIGDRYDRPGS